MSVEDSYDPANVLKKIDENYNPGQSEVLQTHIFWSVQWQNPFDIFLTELRNRAYGCRLALDKIVFTAKDNKIQELLSRDTNLNLKRAIDMCRACKQSTQHAKEMNASGSASHDIDKVSTKGSSHKVRTKSSSHKVRTKTIHTK